MSAGTQNQALAALVSLYNDVLAVRLEKHLKLVRARRPERIPVVLTPREVTAVLSHLSGPTLLMASLPNILLNAGTVVAVWGGGYSLLITVIALHSILSSVANCLLGGPELLVTAPEYDSRVPRNRSAQAA